jgi:hypothetical protein
VCFTSTPPIPPKLGSGNDWGMPSKCAGAPRPVTLGGGVPRHRWKPSDCGKWSMARSSSVGEGGVLVSDHANQRVRSLEPSEDDP